MRGEYFIKVKLGVYTPIFVLLKLHDRIMTREDVDDPVIVTTPK